MTAVKISPPLIYEKTPNAVLPFAFDWRSHIDAIPALLNAPITASTWTVVDGVGLTFGTNSFTNDGTTTYASGGTIGVIYRCKNAVTVGAATLEHFFKISVVDPGA